MFAVDETIEARRARVLIIARSKATAVLFRMSYHEHTGASAFDRSIDGKHDNIIMGLILRLFGAVFGFRHSGDATHASGRQGVREAEPNGGFGNSTTLDPLVRSDPRD